MAKETVGVLLPPGVADTLRKQAGKEGISLSELIRRIVTLAVLSGGYKPAR